jgi:aminoglycoside 6'-N-acetyltransferase
MSDIFPIGTQRLQLRRMRPNDIAHFAAYRSDPMLARYQGWSELSVEQAARFVVEMQDHPAFVEDSWLQVAIAKRPGNELMGDIGFCLHRGGNLEIGFTLASQFHGKGYATEAVGALIAVLSTRPDVQRIFGTVDARNDACVRVLQRLGMTMIGKQEALFKGEMCTELRYALETREPP